MRVASTLTHCVCAVVRVPYVCHVCGGACAVCVDRQEKQQLLDIDKLFLPFVDKYLTQCREKLKEWSQTVPHTHAHHRTRTRTTAHTHTRDLLSIVIVHVLAGACVGLQER